MQRYTVKGMTCDGCKGAVERVTKRVPGVTAVQVDLTSGTLEIQGEPDPAAVVQAVEKAGYPTARAD